VAAKLSKAAKVACEWASRNGVTFDHGKSEAMLSSRRRKASSEGSETTIAAGGREIPFNKEAMTARVQSVAMYGAGWWCGEGKQGMARGAAELQKLVNQEARTVTGCFRTTNRGALTMESSLRPAVSQPENRLGRLGARLLVLPRGSEAKEE